MSKWTRVKAAVLAAAAVAAAFQFGSCLGGVSTQRILELVAIGSIFD
jgi:hypothetical protein